jgi:hypothetical protein
MDSLRETRCQAWLEIARVFTCMRTVAHSGLRVLAALALRSGLQGHRKQPANHQHWE